MMMDDIIGRCALCGESLTMGHDCHKWMYVKTNKKESYINKKVIIPYLRNPYGIDEHELRTARLQAADELERLYKIEKGLKDLVSKIEKHNNGV